MTGGLCVQTGLKRINNPSLKRGFFCEKPKSGKFEKTTKPKPKKNPKRGKGKPLL